MTIHDPICLREVSNLFMNLYSLYFIYIYFIYYNFQESMVEYVYIGWII